MARVTVEDCLQNVDNLFQLVLLAPFLWVMGTQERMLARMMADRYLYTRDGYVQRSPLRRSWF